MVPVICLDGITGFRHVEVVKNGYYGRLLRLPVWGGPLTGLSPDIRLVFYADEIVAEPEADGGVVCEGI